MRVAPCLGNAPSRAEQDQQGACSSARWRDFSTWLNAPADGVSRDDIEKSRHIFADLLSPREPNRDSPYNRSCLVLCNCPFRDGLSGRMMLPSRRTTSAHLQSSSPQYRQSIDYYLSPPSSPCAGGRAIKYSPLFGQARLSIPSAPPLAFRSVRARHFPDSWRSCLFLPVRRAVILIARTFGSSAPAANELSRTDRTFRKDECPRCRSREYREDGIGSL